MAMNMVEDAEAEGSNDADGCKQTHSDEEDVRDGLQLFMVVGAVLRNMTVWNR